MAIIIASFFAAWKITKFISDIAGLVSTIGGAFGTIKNLTGLLGLVKSSIGALVSALGGPLTIAIAAAIAIGILLWKNWDTVKEKCGQLRDWVVLKFNSLKDGALNAITNFCDGAQYGWNIFKDGLNWLCQIALFCFFPEEYFCRKVFGCVKNAGEWFDRHAESYADRD